MSKKQPQKKVNPLLEIASGLITENNAEVWEENPVDVVEFVESKFFLNQKYNAQTGTGCRPKILDILVHIQDPNIREVMLLLGKGSGKDYVASICHLYGIYKCLCLVNPQAYFGLAPSPIYFVNTARNDTQAKKVFFTQFRSLLIECPWFRGRYLEPGMQSVSFIKQIEAISVNSQAYGWLGFNTIQWVGDELAFFLEQDTDDESESRAEECWQAAFGSCKTRFAHHYKMIGITTPRYDDDFVMTKFEELATRKDGYAAQAATWDINPKLTLADFSIEMKRDKRRTMRDFGATPSGIIESFWPEPEILETLVCASCKACPIYQNRKINNDIYACFDYDNCTANMYKGNGQWRPFQLPQSDQNEFWMHFDLAKSKDRLGFSLGNVIGETRVELDVHRLKAKVDPFSKKTSWQDEIDEDEKYEIKPIIKIWAIGWVTSGNRERDAALLINDEYDLTKIMNKNIVSLNKKGFNVVGVTFDQFQSLMMKQTLETQGYETDLISLDRNDEIPVASKYTLLENRVEFPYSALLMSEAKYLKHINAKKVDHAKKSSKDVWDAVAGTIWDCEQRIGTSGTFTPLDGSSDDE